MEFRKKHGQVERQLRIDNRASGNGGKVWAKMVAAARALDPAGVPAEAERVPKAQRARRPSPYQH
jgi:hypothetical protein